MIRLLLYILVAIVMIPVALVRERLFVRAHRQEIDIKKRTRVIRILVGVLLAFAAGSGYLIYKGEYERSEIVASEKEGYRLTVYQIGAPDFPFGQSDCRLLLSEEGRQVDRMDIVLHNDGKWPDETNFDVVWKEDGVHVTVHGEEQEDRTCVLYFDETRTHVLDGAQELKANLISWDKDSFRVVVCDPMDNTVFPDGARLTVDFTEGTYFIDLDGSIVMYDPDRLFFEPGLEKKLRWVEGMVLQIEFTSYTGYSEGNGYYNHATGRRIENVDVVAVDAE